MGSFFYRLSSPFQYLISDSQSLSGINRTNFCLAYHYSQWINIHSKAISPGQQCFQDRGSGSHHRIENHIAGCGQS